MMTKSVHSSGFDALLVLLPGSAITPEGVRLLHKISKFDPFIIKNKLKIKLPYILCPVKSYDIAGTSGDLLESMGIHFLSVRKSFFKLPFEPFPVVSCEFGVKKSRFFNNLNFSNEIYNDEKILLLNGVYTATDEKVGQKSDNDAFPDLKQQKAKKVNSTDLKTFRFVSLYQVMDPNPFIFIDRRMDYTFLGPEKKLTVPENFDAFINMLETVFCCQANSVMLDNGYALKQDQNISEKTGKRFNLKRSKEIITTTMSNETAANQMSRLLFYHWCRENQWVDRIIPKL